MAWNQHNLWTAPSNWNQHNIWASTSAYNASAWRQAICFVCLEDFSTQDNTQISCHNCSYNYPFGAIGDGSLFPRFDADNSSFDGRPPPPPPTESSSLEDSFLSEERSWSDESSDSEESSLSEGSGLSTESSPLLPVTPPRPSEDHHPAATPPMTTTTVTKSQTELSTILSTWLSTCSATRMAPRAVATTATRTVG